MRLLVTLSTFFPQLHSSIIVKFHSTRTIWKLWFRRLSRGNFRPMLSCFLHTCVILIVARLRTIFHKNRSVFKESMKLCTWVIMEPKGSLKEIGPRNYRPLVTAILNSNMATKMIKFYQYLPFCSMYDQNSSVYTYVLNISEHFGNTRISIRRPPYWIPRWPPHSIPCFYP